MRLKLIVAAGLLALLSLAFLAVDQNADRRGRAIAADSALKVHRKELADSIAAGQRVAGQLAKKAARDSLAALAAAARAAASAKRADSLAAVVRVTSATTVTVRDVVYQVPPEIPERFRIDSLAIADGRAALALSQRETATARQQAAAATRLAGLWAQADSTSQRRIKTVEVAAFARGRTRGRIEGAGAVLSAAGAIAALVGVIR